VDFNNGEEAPTSQKRAQGIRNCCGETMNPMRVGVFFGLILLSSSVLPAVDSTTQLPKDGWWVRYFVTMTREGNEDVTVKRTYSLVGTTTENGEKCRWVEIKSVQPINGKEQTDVIKFLIPERELLGGEKPLDSLVRAWRQVDDGPVEEQKFNQPLGVAGMVASADFGWGRDLVIFPGPQRKSKLAAGKKVVDFQQGRLEIGEGWVGKHVATRKALTNGEKQEFSTDFTVWNDATVAPACAAMHERIEYRRNDMLIRTITVELVIEDFGIDAKSTLPENQ
jgi:hypothetical protein